MEMPDEIRDDLHRRLRRIEGQVRGIQAMLDDDRDCRELVTQISAASRALEQVGFKLLASGLAWCLQDPETAEAAGEPVEEFERLFLKLS